uniref:DinB/UmuC family translesion DNA polymerase n=1 Tax=Paraprevotella clara TaxID=454154 RepID=UPI003FEEF19A
MSYFASECARKLREQGTCCGQVTVFAYTSRFRTDVSGNMVQQQVRMPVPTQDAAEIVHAALKALRLHAYDGHFDYKKVGVIVWDLSPREAVQTDLFDKLDRGRRGALIRAVDEINRKNGHNVVKVAALGAEQEYASERQYASRRYTTNLDEVLVVKV